MKFWEAMKALEEGKRVRMKSDAPSHYLLMGIDKLYLCAEGKSYDKSHSPMGIRVLSEWEFYQVPEKTYTFGEVLKFIRMERRFKRKNWPSGCYLDGCQTPVITFKTRVRSWADPYPATSTSIRSPMIEDLEANDWIEVKE